MNVTAWRQDTRHYDIQHYDTQCNNFQHNNMKFNTQHYDIQHNSRALLFWVSSMLSVLAPSCHIHFLVSAGIELLNLGSWVDSSTVALLQLAMFFVQVSHSCLTCTICDYHVTYKAFMLSVIVLNVIKLSVIMMSVVAPTALLKFTWLNGLLLPQNLSVPTKNV